MPAFYCLFDSVRSDSKNLQLRVRQLEEACTDRGVTFVPLDGSNLDFSRLPQAGPTDAVYNCARGSQILEQAMLTPRTRSVYRALPAPSVNQDNHLWSIRLEHENIAAPRTVWHGTNDHSLLRTYIDFLGGFPVVLKTFGGSCGVGAVHIAGWETLFSTCDLLVSRKIDFALRERIHAPSCERLLVLGDSVLAATSRPVARDDFRSDGDPAKSTVFQPDENLARLAVRAAHAANCNFAGIDVMTDPTTNRSYVLEVNCPMDWIAMQKWCNTSIPGALIAWLWR